MGKIDDMIQRLCPNGVEYVPIGKIITRETARRKTDMSISQVFVVSNKLGLIPACEYRDISIESEDTSNYIIVKRGMFAYNPARLNIGSIALMKNYDSGLVSPMYVVFSLNDNINKNFFEYLLKSKKTQKLINSQIEVGARFRFEFNRWNNVLIPVPPIEVQKEIVRVLDQFTAMTAELEAELKARKKQYEYYRDQLLDFGNIANRGGYVSDNQLLTSLSPNSRLFKLVRELCPNGVEFKKLGDLCKVIVGGEPPKNCQAEPDTLHPYAVWGNGKEVYGYSNEYQVDQDSVVISSIGAKAGTIYYRTKNFTPIIRLKVLIPDTDKILSRYLYHALFTIKIDRKSSTVPNLNANEIKTLVIPVPPIPIQDEIVRILDKFEKLTNDISEGLPAEIAARQKQYEYYRDRLLNFKRFEA